MTGQITKCRKNLCKSKLYHPRRILWKLFRKSIFFFRFIYKISFFPLYSLVMSTMLVSNDMFWILFPQEVHVLEKVLSLAMECLLTQIKCIYWFFWCRPYSKYTTKTAAPWQTRNIEDKNWKHENLEDKIHIELKVTIWQTTADWTAGNLSVLFFSARELLFQLHHTGSLPRLEKVGWFPDI